MSNPSLVSLFESLIHKDWQLPQEAGYWIVTETAKGATHTEVKIGGCKSIAFSLDTTGKNAWPFLTSSLDGLRAVCDCIVMAEYNEQNFCILLDMKPSKTSEKKALEQIRSSHFLIKWLLSLLRLHGHWHGELNYCGIISFKPRRTVPKSLSHRTPMPSPTIYRNIPPHVFFSLGNHPQIVLPEIFNNLPQKSSL